MKSGTFEHILMNILQVPPICALHDNIVGFLEAMFTETSLSLLSTTVL